MNAISMGANAKAQLRGFIERLERLGEEKKTISDDEKDVLKEAKDAGFDVPGIRTMLKERKQDKNKREEQAAINDLYRQVLGMIRETGAIAKTPAPSEPQPAPPAEQTHVDTSNPPFAVPSETLIERPMRADEIDEGVSREGVKPAPTDDDLEIPPNLRRTKDS